MSQTSQRVQLQPAFVLHRRPYRETSWLLEVFSRDHGRVGLIARAARQTRKRRSDPLEPARELLLSWTLRGDLGLLGQVEARAESNTLLEGESLLSALYLNELLLRLTTRHDPHPALFDYYRSAISALSAGTVAGPLRLFEKHLLRELGYGLNLEHDNAGSPIKTDSRYDYRLGEGACHLRGKKATGVEVGGGALLALRNEQLTETQSMGEIRRLLRAVIDSHLGQKPLKTPELFRSLRRLGASANAATGQGA